ncbi:hypothetical protein [Streptomyces sp. NPDC003952]
MNLLGWSYRYVGPPDLRALVRPEAEGRSIHSASGFADWASSLAAVQLAEPFTFVIDSTGVLRLAPRRSEHVVCAGGGPVLGAGEILPGHQLVVGRRKRSGLSRDRAPSRLHPRGGVPALFRLQPAEHRSRGELRLRLL